MQLCKEWTRGGGAVVCLYDQPDSSTCSPSSSFQGAQGLAQKTEKERREEDPAYREKKYSLGTSPAT